MSRSNISNFQRQNKIDDFVFFSEKMINEISTRPSVKLYLESNKLKLVRFATFIEAMDHILRVSILYYHTVLNRSLSKDILHPDSILYKTCLTND